MRTRMLLIPLFLTLWPGCQTVMDAVSPPEKTVCRRMSSLCGMKDEQQESCVTQIKELKLDQQRMKAMATCIEKSNSCGEAAGCAAGTGFNAAVDQAKDFLKGMQRALDNK